jgi:ArsR family transcriptional regulator, cadmium/lead-responsive transcriptional repressor
VTIAGDELWAAIAEPSRRRLLDALLATPGISASALARELPLTRQAIAKHLTVLEQSGLVRTAKVGREVQYNVDPERLHEASLALQQAGSRWDQRLQAIKQLAESLNDDSGTR